MEIAYLFILGAIFGSFYFVLATRLPNNESIISPGSHCENCKHLLKWYDLIPIFSYLSVKGKCRYCQKPISSIYPIVEIITGLSFILSYLIYGISYEFFASILLFSLAIIIFISDFKYYIILDSPLIVSSITVFCLKYYYFGQQAALKCLISGLIMFSLLYITKTLGDKIFKQESLGGGDVKLAFVIGVFLGVKLSLITFILSSFLTLPYALTVTYITKKKEVPFGPFIIASALIVFIYMVKFINLLNFFMFI